MGKKAQLVYRRRNRVIFLFSFSISLQTASNGPSCSLSRISKSHPEMTKGPTCHLLNTNLRQIW